LGWGSEPPKPGAPWKRKHPKDPANPKPPIYKLHGIPIRRVLTDRGSTYRSHLFAAACRELGPKHSFTRPCRPRTNGKAERVASARRRCPAGKGCAFGFPLLSDIQTLTREWAYARSYQSSTHRASYLPAFLHDYNFHRPHSALHHLPPSSRLPRPADNVLTNDS
jgi:transposase InsO family protein